jgi:hypothetical protein
MLKATWARYQNISDYWPVPYQAEKAALKNIKKQVSSSGSVSGLYAFKPKR